MLLALDVGNTHVVVGLMEGREVRRSFRIATRRDNAVGDYAVALSQLLELAEVDRQEVEQVIISSVVPPVTRALQGAAVLDEQGAFRGGAILPGANLALSSLAGGTALLPDIPLAVPDRAIGDDTLTCMQSGCVLGSALLLDGLIDRMEAELGRKATVVATGGIAPVIAPACRHEMHMAADLILRGLAVLYEQNK